ncbi:B12 lower ligand biosynthesis ThiC-like protein BzaB [Clostridium formicaceticum]|uniref:Phosphomethylpyrimidine synthase n=1 Tax=Clostridium formicaceticum TaxID=1497 RepID=A0AAC9RIH3_9CLOT|nr:B12 lower ligand biosynthesis ThiC-like protein BzaB [Clostridium formicaceticum]AOY77162.1 phosphomethylpyrimidine synthase [Clostridium formicaceticum]ARE87681.1 Phosphomethylpyrimidine synthase [Clostridium formicaceticum]
MNQIEAARAGKVTEEMEIVALQEQVEVEFIRKGVAEGRIVIPKNRVRNRSKLCGIGAGLDIKVNALIGTSSDRDQMDMEMKKLRIAEEAGCHSFMDLSTGGDIDGMRKQTLSLANVAVGSVPVYQAGVEAIDKKGSIVGMTSDDLFETIEKQAADGMDFMAVHCALNFDIINTLQKTGRVTDVVSRGGSFLTGWMLQNQKENPLYEEFDRLLKIMKAYDVVLSIGDAIRPGSTADSLDQSQIKGLMVAGDLVKRALAAGVQVMIEGPGHVPLNHVKTTMQLQKRLCHNVPYYILGFLATDIAPGYDNITGAIGGAFAGMHGADFLCYLTPAEHLGLPNEDDVRTGVISTRIAAQAANIARKRGHVINNELQMAKARVEMNLEKQLQTAIHPEILKQAMKGQKNEDQHCSACGDDDCAMQVAAKYFGIA